MLGEHPIDVVLLATDLDVARRFYGEKVGLQVIMDSPGGIAFKCGGDGRLFISKSTVETADDQTQASWRVDDLVAEVAELRSHGVEIVEYETPELKTVDGIADLGFALMAWFIDPGKNCLGLTQMK